MSDNTNSGILDGQSVKTLIADSFANSSNGLDLNSTKPNKSSKKNSDQTESKKKDAAYNADVIYDAVHRYKIENVNLSNLQKLHERELINVPFFQKLKKLFTKNMIKSHLMDVLGISKSYTGFHEYVKGDREDLPNAGLCNIAKKIGYNIMTIPIPENISEAEYKSLCAYRDGFIYSVEKLVKEGNIPCTRAKSAPKDKSKYVNNDLLNGLSLDQAAIMDSIKVENIDLENKIGADDVFVDDSEPLAIPTYENYKVNQLSADSINEIGTINTMDNKFEEFTQMDISSDNPFGSFEDIKMTDMSGFVDTFEGFNTLGDIGDNHLDEMELAVLEENKNN